MRIVNLAHGNLYAFGAYVTAWVDRARLAAALAMRRALPACCPRAPWRRPPSAPCWSRRCCGRFYKRAEEYQLLVTFGLLMILEDVMRLLWGPYPLTASVLCESSGSVSIGGDPIRPTTSSSSPWAAVAAVFLWAFIYRTRFGVVLRATSQDMRMASALGVNVNRVYVQAFTLGCLMAGLGGAIIVPSQSAVLGMGVDALILSFIVVVIGGLGSLEGALVGALIVGVVREAGHRSVPGDRAGRALPHRRRRPARPAGRPLRARMSTVTAVALEHRCARAPARAGRLARRWCSCSSWSAAGWPSST